MKSANWSRSAPPLLALLAVLLLTAAEPAFVRDLQLRLFDGFQRLRPRPYTETAVRIVEIDDESLERLGQWPWPRTQIAGLIDRLSDLGAAVIAFDMVFAEPDRTSPPQILPLWARHGAVDDLNEIAAALPDHDEELARSMARTQVVTGFPLTPGPGPRIPLKKHGLAHAGDNPRLFLRPPYQGAVTNLPALEAAAAGNGSFAIDRDRDGLIRAVPLLYRLGSHIYPSLAAEALRVALGSSTYMVRSSGASGETAFGESTGIAQVRIAPEFSVPTDRRGRVWVHFTEPTPERYVPAWRVMEGEVDPSRIEGQIVFVGATAAGLGDLRATPIGPEVPGVSLHAEVVEHVLLGHHLGRPDWATGAELLFTLAWGLLLVLLIRRAGALWCAAVGCLGVGGAFATSWFSFVHWRMLFDPLFPSLAGFAVYLSGSLVNYLHAESERRRIRSAFSHYLSPPLVKELATHPERLRLGGETKGMSILFADIRDFTAISEKFDAEGLTRVLNTFLTPMTEVILERSGTIDKYIGDSIMAFWNAPLDDPEHATRACEAALAMIRELDSVNERLRRDAEATGRPHIPLRIGVGINSGEVCVGNMGSEHRFDYSVIGDEVNLASRLEGQSKQYGVGIVIGEGTQSVAGDFATLELDLIRVRGKTQPARIHALLGDSELRGRPEFQELLELHDSMLKAYRAQDWELAGSLIEECASFDLGLEELYQLYRNRVERYRLEPPPSSWDGVYTAAEK